MYSVGFMVHCITISLLPFCMRWLPFDTPPFAFSHHWFLGIAVLEWSSKAGTGCVCYFSGGRRGMYMCVVGHLTSRMSVSNGWPLCLTWKLTLLHGWVLVWLAACGRLWHKLRVLTDVCEARAFKLYGHHCWGHRRLWKVKIESLFALKVLIQSSSNCALVECIDKMPSNTWLC